MPRQSRASLEAMPLDRFDGRPHRVKPPDNLGENERALWLRLVAGCPNEHFKTTDEPLLRAYVSVALLVEQAAREMQSSGGPITDAGAKWFAVHTRALRSMSVLSLRLRLAPSARATVRDTGRAAANHRPPSYYDMVRDGRA